MSLGVLFESHEWSTFRLIDDLRELGVDAVGIDLEEGLGEGRYETKIYSCDMLVNRVFASAIFRNHEYSLNVMPQILKTAEIKRIPMINTYKTFYYETDKALVSEILKNNSIRVPETYCQLGGRMGDRKACYEVGQKIDRETNNKVGPKIDCETNNEVGQKIDCAADREAVLNSGIRYPCIVKPNCGGRSNSTYIIKSQKDMISSLPHIIDNPGNMIVQQYIPPIKGYITRVEVIGGECVQILKRGIADGGLSAYRFGSTYESYDDCPQEIQEISLKTMAILEIETGSLDIIETKDADLEDANLEDADLADNAFVIDVNAVSNTSEDCIEPFGFDLIKETAKYIATQYFKLFPEQKGVRNEQK